MTANASETPVSGELVRKIENVLCARLAAYGLSSVNVYPDVDHDGDPIIMVEACYTPSGDDIDSRETYAAGKEVRSVAREMGERRFPHVRHLFDDNETVSA